VIWLKKESFLWHKCMGCWNQARSCWSPRPARASEHHAHVVTNQVDNDEIQRLTECSFNGLS